jgi:hypothetical protein
MPTIRAANAETDVIFSNKHADSATAFAAAVSICLALGVHSVATATSGDEIYARPGHLVTAQGTRLNFYCTGRGSPTVVFDSGWGDWAPVWTIVQPEVGGDLLVRHDGIGRSLRCRNDRMMLVNCGAGRHQRHC